MHISHICFIFIRDYLSDMVGVHRQGLVGVSFVVDVCSGLNRYLENRRYMRVASAM